MFDLFLLEGRADQAVLFGERGSVDGAGLANGLRLSCVSCVCIGAELEG